jgi:hypothetical protein
MTSWNPLRLRARAANLRSRLFLLSSEFSHLSRIHHVEMPFVFIIALSSTGSFDSAQDDAGFAAKGSVTAFLLFCVLPSRDAPVLLPTADKRARAAI